MLGFAHEEEFALLSLAVGGVDPWILMILYGSCVLASLVGITLASVRVYAWLAPFVKKRAKYIPKISAITLLILCAFMGLEFFI